MIRIEVKAHELLDAIRTERPTWLRRARATTEYHREKGSYSRKTPKWSEIKGVYIDWQYAKCAYCERKLSPKEIGKNEWDVEHFRPKGQVSGWPTPEIREERGIDYDIPLGSTSIGKGYHLLSHHPFNYVTACKPCNQVLKGDFFPVAGRRRLSGDDPARMASEKAYLVYPLGESDDDPRELISFVGVHPVPVPAAGDEYWRARVTIDFFDLATRDDLIEQRAGRIIAMWLAMETASRAEDAANRELAERVVRAQISPAKPHTSCSLAFYRLYRDDWELAEEIYRDAVEIYAQDPGDISGR